MTTTTPSYNERTPFSVAFASNDLDPAPAMVKKGSKTSRNVTVTAMISFTGIATAALMFCQHYNYSTISMNKNDLILNKVESGWNDKTKTNCVVATGTFNNANSYKKKPLLPIGSFETCYQYGNEDKYCWSNSFYDDAGNALQCDPLDFGDDDSFNGWHTVHWYYVNPHGTCGQPCTEFEPFVCLNC